MAGMDRVFQSAATVDSILRGDLIEKAAKAGLRSLFVGLKHSPTKISAGKQEAESPKGLYPGR